MLWMRNQPEDHRESTSQCCSTIFHPTTLLIVYTAFITLFE